MVSPDELKKVKETFQASRQVDTVLKGRLESLTRLANDPETKDTNGGRVAIRYADFVVDLQVRLGEFGSEEAKQEEAKISVENKLFDINYAIDSIGKVFSKERPGEEKLNWSALGILILEKRIVEDLQRDILSLSQ